MSDLKQQNCGIYKITNLIDGKVYIGQSINIKERWQDHRKLAKSGERNTRLYHAMREEGIENFCFEVIEFCSKEKLNEKEKFYIQEYNTLNPDYGYNMSVIENLQRRFNRKEVQEVQELLKSSKYTNKELAQMFKVSHSWITLVNKGELWYDANLEYPLRPLMKTDFKESNCCIECGAKISRNATRCEKCYNKNRNVVSLLDNEKFKILVNKKKEIEENFNFNLFELQREAFKELVRNKQFIEIGKEFNIATKTVRRWCERFALPRSKREINAYSDEEWSKI